jgi:hypothetical protein
VSKGLGGYGLDYYETKKKLSYAAKNSGERKGFLEQSERNYSNPYLGKPEKEFEVQSKLKLLKSKNRAINFVGSETKKVALDDLKKIGYANRGPDLLRRLDNYQARHMDDDQPLNGLFEPTNVNYRVKFRPKF